MRIMRTELPFRLSKQNDCLQRIGANNLNYIFALVHCLLGYSLEHASFSRIFGFVWIQGLPNLSQSPCGRGNMSYRCKGFLCNLLGRWSISVKFHRNPRSDAIPPNQASRLVHQTYISPVPLNFFVNSDLLSSSLQHAGFRHKVLRIKSLPNLCESPDS